MTPESLQIEPQKEQISNRDGLNILFPGLAGTIDSNTGMLSTFERVVKDKSTGKQKFILHPSDISTDFQYQREEYECEEIAKALSEGKDVRLVAHSMGAVTLAQMVEKLQSNYPGLLTDESLK
jgi:hypothetical protein